MGYTRFAAMIATSTLLMYGLMYLNTWAIEHVFHSQTRAWMALCMGGMMAIVMMGFMWAMYPSRAANWCVLGLGAAALIAGVFFVRSQATVGDISWMKAMIPHHSIAVLTSERASLSDPRVIDLSNRIVEAQRLEIDEMKALIADLQGGPAATSDVDVE